MDNTQLYNFPVELQPIYFGSNQEITDKKVVVRTDTLQPLGVVSNGYGLVHHGVVVDAFREAAMKYHVEEKIRMSNNGTHLYYQMLFPKVEAEVAKGDIIRMMVTIKNSYDGHGSLQIIFGALRLICLNGMVLGSKFLSFQYRHIGDVKGLANSSMIEQCSQAYKHHIKMFGEKTPLISQMTKTPMKLEYPLMFQKNNTKLPEYLLSEAESEYATADDSTVWGYYNALTYAVTHKMKNESPRQQIRYGVTAWKNAEKYL